MAVEIDKNIEMLPRAPGVYLLKDKKGATIYVGKAKNLRHRVRSYFHLTPSPSAKVNSMVAHIADVDYIVTSNEKEALILESTLIKRYRPRYNVILKDDKSYPYLKLTLQEQFPRLFFVRRVKKDNALYFGPFSSAQAVRETMKVVHQNFLLRKCQTTQFQLRQRPCLNFQMGQCPAPCFKLIDEKNYRFMVKEVELFLKGKNRELTRMLEEQMESASEQLNFEKAARIRDRLTSLKMTLEKQKAVTTDFTDRDIIAFHREDSSMVIIVLFARGGKIIGSKEFTLKGVAVADEEVISAFLEQFYREGKYVPREIFIPVTLEDRQVIQEFLKERRGKAVALITPQRGEKKRLIEIARLNAESAFALAQKRIEDAEKSARELKERLHLRVQPSTIECFDISNLGGECAVGSMVHFKDGEALKDFYRRFRIRTVEGADDCAMLYEVLKRRFANGEKDVPCPDVVMVDGGKGQLNAALAVFKELEMTSIDVVALAKGRTSQRKGVHQKHAAPEQIFLPQRKNPLILHSHSSALLLLERVRDEAHRFALSYHRRLRNQKDFSSSLDAITGVGAKTRTLLLKHFGSVDKVSSASLEDLSRVPHLKPKVAEAIYNFYKDK